MIRMLIEYYSIFDKYWDVSHIDDVFIIWWYEGDHAHVVHIYILVTIVMMYTYDEALWCYVKVNWHIHLLRDDRYLMLKTHDGYDMHNMA